MLAPVDLDTHLLLLSISAPFSPPTVYFYVAAASLTVFVFRQANLRICNYSHGLKLTQL